MTTLSQHFLKQAAVDTACCFLDHKVAIQEELNTVVHGNVELVETFREGQWPVQRNREHQQPDLGMQAPAFQVSPILCSKTTTPNHMNPQTLNLKPPSPKLLDPKL